MESILFWRWLHLVCFNHDWESWSCNACLTDSRDQSFWFTRFLHVWWDWSADWFDCHVSHAQSVDKRLILHEVHTLSCTIDSFPYLTPFALDFFGQTWWGLCIFNKLYFYILDVPAPVRRSQQIYVSYLSTTISEGAWLERMIQHWIYFNFFTTEQSRLYYSQRSAYSVSCLHFLSINPNNDSLKDSSQ